MLTKDEYRDVARIHVESISKGFLSTLGIRFLALLYEAIDRSEGSILIVARDENRVIGFVAGTVGLGEVFRIMFKSWIRLAVAIFPALFSPKKVYRISETLLFSGAKNRVDTIECSLKCELLSIAVSSGFRRKGVAEALFNELTLYFQKNGVTQFKIVVGDALAPAHKFYRRLGAYPVARAEVHKGSWSTIYVLDINKIWLVK